MAENSGKILKNILRCTEYKKKFPSQSLLYISQKYISQ